MSTTVPGTFADVEWLITTHLRAQLGASGVTVVTELPLQLADRVPVVRVLGAGGHDDRITSRERVDVESFAATRGEARELAGQVRTAMHAASHTVIDGWLIDLVHTEAGPMWLDYQNENVRRYLATYLVLTRVRSTR
jgi:hypothetical protein